MTFSHSSWKAAKPGSNATTTAPRCRAASTLHAPAPAPMS
jgi:hypothetical protein